MQSEPHERRTWSSTAMRTARSTAEGKQLCMQSSRGGAGAGEAPPGDAHLHVQLVGLDAGVLVLAVHQPAENRYFLLLFLQTLLERRRALYGGPPGGRARRAVRPERRDEFLERRISLRMRRQRCTETPVLVCCALVYAGKQSYRVSARPLMLGMGAHLGSLRL